MATLYIVATPIGNLEDVTHRAVRILQGVSVIYAEDTRVTKRLLGHYTIETQLSSWHEHSTERDWQKIKNFLQDGQDVAYVTDAGTPGISDPGGKLVEHVVKELPDVSIVPIPGPSALAAAISIAGIPLHEFTFYGFLPHKKGRAKKIAQISAATRPVILYESVHRIRKLLEEVARFKRHIILCRELSKKFETIYRGTAEEILESMTGAELKGEFVVIVEADSIEANFELFEVSQVAILIRDNKCLIVRFQDAKSQWTDGLWGLPGGRVDQGEKGEESFRREILEEIGISKFDILGVVDSDIWYRPSGTAMCGLAYLISNDSAEITLSDEHSEYRWVSEAELDSFEFVWSNAKRMIRRGFALRKD